MLLGAGPPVPGRTRGGGEAEPQDATLRVTAENGSGGWYPVVHVSGLLDDPALEEALSSGLPLRIRIRTELWSKALFDRLVGAQELALAIVQDPLDGSFIVSNGREEQHVEALGQAADLLSEIPAPELQPRGSGRFYYLATLRAETLSLSDLEELQRWLRGKRAPRSRGKGRSGGRWGAGSAVFSCVPSDYPPAATRHAVRRSRFPEGGSLDRMRIPRTCGSMAYRLHNRVE